MKRDRPIRAARTSPGRKDPVRVSTHALFRWLERSGVLEVERLRASLALALDRAYQAGAAMDQGEFLILAGAMVFVVREGTVVTVVEDDEQNGHANLLKRKAGDGQTKASGQPGSSGQDVAG